eukprot:CAMPEP_0197900080 /NCGR_PEP_ID=MMETSP1439-20131203/48197_1 /TAXON_ID=66791 /ORGANISM="Gonyaulax spinifera, Strain CCMP409" /LENGTH=587 /DNA_ID=CAMNT_0043520939 /DNA_START=29 /DNA_END=1792 /DNA_ORIENTATION=+
MAMTLALHLALAPLALACFAPLSAPLDEQPVDDRAVALLRKHFLANLNVDGTGAVIASPGPTPVLDQVCNGGCPGGYAFHWDRDAALSMITLRRLVGTELATAGGGIMVTPLLAQQIVLAYAGWIQRTRGKASISEPKWNISTGRPYEFGWCRPQTDGPALRAQAMLLYIDIGLQAYQVQNLWELARADLDWVANGTDSIIESCDIWEESREKSFLWNHMMMRKALVLGIQVANNMGDSERAAAYTQAAEKFMLDPVSEHFQERQGESCFITQCPPVGAGSACHKYGKSVDGAVILSLVHSYKPVLALPAGMKPHVLPTSEAVARTVHTYNEVFCELYPVNRQDTAEGVPGVLYGRYIKDKYGGDGLGNPWQLITASLASLFYQAAQAVQRGVVLGPRELAVWRVALNSTSFNGSVSDFVAVGDAVMLRIVHHVRSSDNWHLYEQIDKVTGEQLNAKDLTWSYAEIIDALLERRSIWPTPAACASTQACSGALADADITGRRLSCSEGAVWPDSEDLNPDDLMGGGGMQPGWPRLPAGLAIIFVLGGCIGLVFLCNLRKGEESESEEDDLEDLSTSSESEEGNYQKE